MYCFEQKILDESKNEEFEKRAREIVDDANEFARNAPYPPAEEGLKGVWGALPELK